ncbi:Forkhead box protein N1 [Liparis tanakae]|uniref:Forkhead box protein N1 n=1 Tax=Liparis tanakae TaxID=230148 RepID=A0A4Z2EKX6_9TELE|nr:Forkhead box protein N1 [Liparis tanakae]
MSDALTFSHSGESTSSPPAGPRTCDPRGTPRQPEAGSQMTMIPPRSREAGGIGFTRQQSADFSLRPGGDGTAGSGSGSVDSDRLLIFLALRNSAAGRLPVSEIYGFMTQHFPYFKVPRFTLLYVT